MNRLLLLAILAISILLPAYCQQNSFPNEGCQFLATYRLTFQPDSTDNSIRRVELMNLMLGKSTSLFESVGNHLSDSLYATVANTPPSGETVQLFMNKLQNIQPSRFRYKLYKNSLDKFIFTYDKVDGKLYHYSESTPLFNWHVLPDKQTIAGYNCQHAVTTFAGRRYDAWFTREIPFSDGPYKFNGLPGLIIKVNDTRKHYTFELISFKKAGNSTLITLPTQPAVSATKANVQRAQRNYYANLKQMVATRTSSVTTSAPENEQAMQSRIQKKYNNSIEIR